MMLSKKMRCIIVDDEQPNCRGLQALLENHCPGTEIVGMAHHATDAYELIRQLKPDLIFLDIKMPGQSGFDLLRLFDHLDFHVIFVSGFDQYAIQAFEFNAVDYILKPVDYTKLVGAVERAASRYQKQENVVHFIHSLDEQMQFVKKIRLHHQGKVQVVNLADISYLQATRGYSQIHLSNNTTLISSKTLADYEIILEPFNRFIRINKTHIINIDHIEQYTKGAECYIRMRSTQEELEVSRRKKKDILQVLKDLWPGNGLISRASSPW